MRIVDLIRPALARSRVAMHARLARAGVAAAAASRRSPSLFSFLLPFYFWYATNSIALGIVITCLLRSTAVFGIMNEGSCGGNDNSFTWRNMGNECLNWRTLALRLFIAPIVGT